VGGGYTQVNNKSPETICSSRRYIVQGHRETQLHMCPSVCVYRLSRSAPHTTTSIGNNKKDLDLGFNKLLRMYTPREKTFRFFILRNNHIFG
jgi:hypothetical protein